MPSKYFYRIYGLTISSEIQLQSVPTIEPCDTDIILTIGNIPVLKATNVATNLLVANDDETIITYKGYASYYVGFGNRIIVKPVKGASEYSVRRFVVSSCMSLIMTQRSMLPIHSACLKLPNDKTVLIIGESGAGKSSLATAIRKNGGTYLSDDITGISIEDMGVIAHPGYSEIRLWKQTIDEYNDEEQVMDISPVPDLEGKYYYVESSSFEFTSRPIDLIVYLKHSDQEDVSIEKLEGFSKVELLLKQAVNLQLLPLMNKEKEQFGLVSKLSQTKMYKLCRPKDILTMDEQINKIVEVSNEFN